MRARTIGPTQAKHVTAANASDEIKRGEPPKDEASGVMAQTQRGQGRFTK